jgi:telomere length regulation protein
LLSKSLNLFGDKLYIKHTPTSGQEGKSNFSHLGTYKTKTTTANAQVVLLAAGYVHRSQPPELVDLGRSGVYLNAVSNRLAATSPRSRFLGMVVAMAISALVDSPGKAMKFDIEEMDSEEAKWYRSLTSIEDNVGPIQNLSNWNGTTTSRGTDKDSKGSAMKHQTANFSHAKTHTSKVVAIEEVSTDSEEEDDDLMAYEKPDSDASDSEDDPTLIQRSKPTAPV